MTRRPLLSHLPVAALLLLALLSCGGDKNAKGNTEHAARPAAGARAGGAFRGKKVDVKMYSDPKGERYEPAEVEVDRGDSLRFVLASGVHNVHFLPEKNPAGPEYPPTSIYLQLPGQTVSYLMDWPEGRYYFQCDIHVLLGMHGYVKVTEDGSHPSPFQ